MSDHDNPSALEHSAAWLCTPASSRPIRLVRDGHPVYCAHFPGGDPRRYEPDRDAIRPEEEAAWHEACARAASGEAEQGGSGFYKQIEGGGVIGHLEMFGPGVYWYEKDPEEEAAPVEIAEYVRRLLSEHPEAQEALSKLITALETGEVYDACREPLEAWTEAPACTEISAVWCPIHGYCTCPEGPFDDDPGEDPDCPLHGVDSKHADQEPDGWRFRQVLEVVG